MNGVSFVARKGAGHRVAVTGARPVDPLVTWSVLLDNVQNRERSGIVCSRPRSGLRRQRHILSLSRGILEGEEISEIVAEIGEVLWEVMSNLIG